MSLAGDLAGDLAGNLAGDLSGSSYEPYRLLGSTLFAGGRADVIREAPLNPGFADVWYDLVGGTDGFDVNNALLQGASARQPSLGSGGAPNGRSPFLSFDGVSDAMDNAGLPFDGERPGIYVVGRFRSLSVGSDGTIAKLGTDAGANGSSWLVRASDGAWGCVVYDQTPAVDDASPIAADTGWHVFYWALDDASPVSHVDGVATSPSITTTGTLEGGEAFAVGATDDSGSGAAPVDLLEWGILRTALSASQESALLGYCARQYGFSF